MLVLDLGVSRVEGPEGRHGRPERALLHVCHPVRILGVEPPRVVLHDRRHGRQVAAEPCFQILVEDLQLDQIFEKILGYFGVFCPLRDQTAQASGHTRYRLAVVAEGQAHRNDVVVILLFLDDGDLGRERAVEIHHDLLAVKGVVVVGIVPVDRPRRHKALLIGGGGVGQRIERRLAHLRVVEMQFAVIGDDVLPTIGDQERVEQRVAIIASGV